ncbi:MAG: glutaredoxin family protein [Zoogloeaceae bacterium]|jgi:glutaredoxin|nr:glutaredoxin family protein [Zoogloeaceae bacterium]
MMKSRVQVLTRFVSAGILALACCAAAQAQTWRWTDTSGRTVYSDLPPPGNARNVVRISSGGNNEYSNEELPFATRQAAQKYPVTLYTGANCDPCTQARELLNKRTIPFTEKSVQSEADINELVAQVGGKTLPGLRVGSQKVQGFEPFTYNNVLDLAGYPKASAGSTLPPPSPPQPGLTLTPGTRQPVPPQ